jgi:hypothetical protein
MIRDYVDLKENCDDHDNEEKAVRSRVNEPYEILAETQEGPWRQRAVETNLEMQSLEAPSPEQVSRTYERAISRISLSMDTPMHQESRRRPVIHPTELDAPEYEEEHALFCLREQLRGVRVRGTRAMSLPELTEDLAEKQLYHPVPEGCHGVVDCLQWSVALLRIESLARPDLRAWTLATSFSSTQMLKIAGAQPLLFLRLIVGTKTAPTIHNANYVSSEVARVCGTHPRNLGLDIMNILRAENVADAEVAELLRFAACTMEHQTSKSMSRVRTPFCFAERLVEGVCTLRLLREERDYGIMRLRPDNPRRIDFEKRLRCVILHKITTLEVTTNEGRPLIRRRTELARLAILLERSVAMKYERVLQGRELLDRYNKLVLTNAYFFPINEDNESDNEEHKHEHRDGDGHKEGTDDVCLGSGQGSVESAHQGERSQYIQYVRELYPKTPPPKEEEKDDEGDDEGREHETCRTH